jgi:hypothetical protein
MKIKVKLSIGYRGAEQEDYIVIEDEELEWLTEEEINEYCLERTQEWSEEYINVSYIKL